MRLAWMMAARLEWSFYLALKVGAGGTAGDRPKQTCDPPNIRLRGYPMSVTIPRHLTYSRF